MQSDLKKTTAEIIEGKYRNKYKNYPLENIIVFRSGPMRSQYIEGTDFFDNSRALFEYMLENNYNKKYELVWLVKNPDKFLQYKKYSNVKFLSFDWEDSGTVQQQDEYYRALCLAKYLFTTDAYGYMLNSRNDQVRVQLWHGCGFKTRMNFARCEDRYEYTTVISDLYSDIHQNIYGLRPDQMLITGYAKHDWLFKPYNKKIYEILDIAKASKYIFWTPTFRMADERFDTLSQYNLNPDTGLPIIEKMEQFIHLNELLIKNDTVLIIKPHFLQNESFIKDIKFSNIALISNKEMSKNDLILNRLLASVDALISDYSSTAVDFLNVDKPIAFTLDDVEKYEKSRGFVFENIHEWLPGKEIYNFNDFCKFINDVANERDVTREKRKNISNRMLKYHDDNNCKRICNVLGITLEE